MAARVVGRPKNDGNEKVASDQGEDGPGSLPHGGVELLAQLITHQDTITWAVVGASLAAETALLSAYLPAWNPVTGPIGTTPNAVFFLVLAGHFVTLTSLFLVHRSIRYMNAYILLARDRAVGKDKQIFKVHVGWPPALYMITCISAVFEGFWIYAAWSFLQWKGVF